MPHRRHYRIDRRRHAFDPRLEPPHAVSPHAPSLPPNLAHEMNVGAWILGATAPLALTAGLFSGRKGLFGQIGAEAGYGAGFSALLSLDTRACSSATPRFLSTNKSATGYRLCSCPPPRPAPPPCWISPSIIRVETGSRTSSVMQPALPSLQRATLSSTKPPKSPKSCGRFAKAQAEFFGKQQPS